MLLKKIRTVLNIGLILFLLISLLGCSQKQVDNNQSDGDTVINEYALAENNETESESFGGVFAETSELPLEVPSDDEGSSESPRIVVFESIDEFVSFTKAVELSDKDFEAFIYDEASGKYDMNGVENKDDLRGILAWLSGAPIPVSPNYSIRLIAIYPEWKEISFHYANKDGIRCSFRMKMGSEATFEDCLQNGKDNSMPLREVSLPENHIAKRIVYLSKNTSQYLYASPAYYFLLDYENCFAYYQTFGIKDYDAAVDALYEFTYSDILSLGVG